MTVTRRRLLATLPALAMPAILRGLPAYAASGQTLSLPALDEGRMDAGVRAFALNLANGQMEFLAGQMTDTYGINGNFLGPVLRMQAGDMVRFDVRNALPDPTALHWHGMHLPAAMDGGPHQPIAPGGLWQPTFRVRQNAGTFWFHSHAHGQTGAQVWAGLAGMIRIEDQAEADLPLPRTYGEDDFPLIIQDRRFDEAGQMPYAPNQHDLMAGLQGDQMMVNGQIGAVLTASVPRIRLRILNGSNGSIYRMHFSDGRHFYQIASDGGLLPAPVAMTDVMLAPGERGEFLIDQQDGQATMLRAELFGAESAIMGSAGIRDVIELRPGRKQAAAPALPARLAYLPPALPGADSRRTFTLEMSGGGMMGSPVINRQSYDHGRIDFSVPLGASETWVFENKSDMLHPMHIHDTQFRILSRNGLPPAPHEQGLKDTVLTHPGETVELALSFADYKDPVAPYMLHCHILEHEDAGMMQQFTVV